MGPMILAPVKKNSKNADTTMWGRLNLIYSMLSQYRSTNGMNLDKVMQFVNTALEFTTDKVWFALSALPRKKGRHLIAVQVTCFCPT